MLGSYDTMDTTPIDTYFDDIDADITFDYGQLSTEAFNEGDKELTLYFDPVSNLTTAVVMRQYGTLNQSRPYTCTWKGVFDEEEAFNFTLYAVSIVDFVVRGNILCA